MEPSTKRSSRRSMSESDRHSSGEEYGSTPPLQPRTSRRESQIGSEGLDQRYKNLEDQLGNHSAQLSNIEMRYVSIQAKLESMRMNLTEVEGSISQVQISQGVTLNRLDQLENSVGLIDKNIKSYIAKKLAPIKGKLSPETHSSQVTLQLETSIQSRIERYCEDLGLQDLRKDVLEIKEQHELGERTVETLRDILVEVRDQVTRAPLSANVSRSAHTSTPCPPDPNQSSRECEVIKSSIERSIRLIRQLTETELTLGSDVGLIKKCNKEDTGKVNRYVKACEDNLLRYIKYPGADQEFCDEIRSVLDKADDWVVHVESIYARSEAHAISDARGDITKIGIFANNAEKTVFEFIEETDLGMLGWGTSKQRASLVCKHLSEEIKSRIADFSDDFAKIREWLIKTYGRADRIIGDILKALSMHQAPAMHDKPERYAYLARISMAVARFDKLAKIPDINISSLNSILYCMNTVFGLIQLLPSQDQDQLRRKMTERNLDWDNPQGAATYALFKEYCETERNIVSAYQGLESKNKLKSKSVFTTSVEREEEYAGSSQIHTANYTPPAPWYSLGRKFPCPLETHDHEMAECLEWLTMSPNERWNNTKVRRICYCCLRPKSVCNEKRCKFSKEVNELITCQGCVTYAASQGWAPFSILMCRKPQHAKVRANYSDIKKTLDKYLGKISTNVNELNLKVSANLVWQVHAAAPVTRRGLDGSSEIQGFVGNSVPCINTSSGERVFPEKELIKSESTQHAHYLMQILQIGESQILAFFDSGANSHLISGEVAVRENLEKYSDTPTKITVVGGGTVCSEYGSFNFCLGPDQENRFHELRCIGMEDLTSDFRKYDLNDIKNEYNSSLEKNRPREPLPEYVGGGKVQLLIGIKNSHLMPVLIKTLDSGVGVYKSPFKDIFGSRIIFAGPHTSFTRGNRGIREEESHAVFHIYQRKEELAAGTQIPHLWVGDKRTGAGVNYTPLRRTDFNQLGADLEPETQSYQIQQIQKKGGFSWKYEGRSGEDPDPKSSTDGISTNLLGYIRETKEDILRPGLSELNLNKRIKGAKKPYKTPGTSIQEAEKLFQPLSIARKQIISRIAELFDPGDVWEPWMKLDFKDMPLITYNMLSLDRKGQEEIQKEWFAELVLPESQNMSIKLLNSGPAPSGPIGARVWNEFRIDPLGWKKTIRILNIVLKFKDTVKHKTFRGYSVVECQRSQDNHQKDILFKYESQIIGKTISSKKLSKFTENERLVYFQKRISNENPFKSKDSRIPLVDTQVSIQGISTIGSVSRNRRDISFTFVTDELFINTPEHFKNLFSQKTKIDCDSVIGFLDFKMIKPNSGVQSKILYLLTNLKLKVSKTYRTITYYVTHDYCSREKGKLTEMRVEEMRKIVEERVRLARSTAPQGSSDLLVRQPQVVSWGTKKTFNPESLITVFVRYRPVMGRKQDESYMTKYLNRVMVNGLQDPGIGLRSAFLPEGAPLLEYLAVYQEKMDSGSA